MKYNKPEIATLAAAVRGIQGQTTKISPHQDNSQALSAPAAYEADE